MPNTYIITSFLPMSQSMLIHYGILHTEPILSIRILLNPALQAVRINWTEPGSWVKSYFSFMVKSNEEAPHKNSSKVLFLCFFPEEAIQGRTL